MKKILLAAMLIIGLQSCKKENNFVTLSGKINNLEKTDTLLTISNKTFKRAIALNADGTFNDTLTVPKANYYSILINAKNSGFIFLRNGFDMQLDADNNSFFEGLKFSGKGGSSSNYLVSQLKFSQSLGNPRSWFLLEKPAFDKKLEAMKYSFDSITSLYKEIDTMLIRINGKQHADFFSYLESNYTVENATAKKEAAAKVALQKGNPSPKFKDYVNSKGGKTSLDSFKGKYVYIDVWATWCKPCLSEVPALKSLEKEYHKKNIEFVSISIDNKNTAGSWEKAQIKWLNMVKGKSLTGSQLFAGEDIAFSKAYLVNNIPRFILIDPKGNIVNENAPRPSNPLLRNVFKELGI